MPIELNNQGWVDKHYSPAHTVYDRLKALYPIAVHFSVPTMATSSLES